MLKPVIGTIALVARLAACSSPSEDAARAQEDAFKAQEKVAEERLRLVEEYQDCVEEAGDDQTKAAACESYLRAAEALK